jgi:8-oxo-dGTP pyrophosphatase MutT (NUDIX family)
MSKTYNFCNNCGKSGHLFNTCKHPITSIGVIAYKHEHDKFKFLMIRRKDSLGYVDFMRGKYPIYNKNYLQNIIDEMTLDEKKKLLNNDFNILWSDLWGSYKGIQYRGEEKTSKDKFESLKLGITIGGVEYTLQSLIDDSTTSWDETEWGFPKGRREYQEKDITCALREFEEETGYQRTSLKIIHNLLPFEEIFTGSNYKSYKHRYFVAKIDNDIGPQYSFQECEVSDIRWCSADEALTLVRSYNVEKKEVLKRVNTLLNEYRLYP